MTGNSIPNPSTLLEGAEPVKRTVDEVADRVLVVEGVGVALSVWFPRTVLFVDSIAMVVEIYADVDAGGVARDSVAVIIGQTTVELNTVVVVLAGQFVTSAAHEVIVYVSVV